MDSSELRLAAALKQVADSRVSRRDAIQTLVAMGLAWAAADRLVSSARAATPTRGGQFRLGVAGGASTDTLDPAKYNNTFSGTAFWGTLSNGLTEIDADGDVVGDISESFESSAGNKTWAFKLREGVTFHNGQTLRADDVVASIQHHRGETSGSPAGVLLQDVASIKADGRARVIFELTRGNPDFPFILADYHLPIMPTGDGGTSDWSSGIRTGAYKLERLQPGVQAIFSRNENYYKQDRGWFDSVKILAIGDMTARTNALLSGEIDHMDRCDPKILPLLESNPGIRILETIGYGSYAFAMNVTAKPFEDRNVRAAVKHSMNREEILNVVFLGHGTIGNDTPIAPSVKFAFDPLPRHTYNPAKARDYLKKAGLEKLRLDLSVSDAAFTGAVDCAMMWREQAKACNIDINVIRESDDGYFTNVWRKKPFVATYWFGRPTVDWMMTTGFVSNAPYNDTSWSNTGFDELLAAARSEDDESKRAAIYAEVQQILHDDGGLVTALFNSYVEAHVRTLGHSRVASNVQLDGMRIAERWWFDS